MEPGRNLELTCSKCTQDYVGVTAFVQHLLESHKGRNFVIVKCVGCSFKGSTARPEWVKHLGKQHNLGEKPLPCPAPECRNKRRFASWRQLSIHSKDCHNGRCNRCEMDFGSAKPLRAHKNNCVKGKVGHGARPSDSQVANAQFRVVEVQSTQPDLQEATEMRSHIPPEDSAHVRATVYQPVAVPRTPPLFCQRALDIITGPSPHDQKAAELLINTQGRDSEAGRRATADVKEKPRVLDLDKPFTTPGGSYWISCTTRELKEYHNLYQPKVNQCSTIRIRDGDRLEQGSNSFLRWINNGGRFEGKFTSRSGIRKAHFLSSDGFLARYDARRGPQRPHGSSSFEDCLSIQTSGRALQDVTALPISLSLLDCDLLHLLEHRIPEQHYRLATAGLQGAAVLKEAAIDPSIRTVSYRERGSFEPWRADLMAGFWVQIIEGWTVYLRYIGPASGDILAASISHGEVRVPRNDHVQITYVGPGDVLFMRPEMSQSEVSEPVIYCSFVLEDTLAIRSPVWPNKPAELLKTLHHINDFHMDKDLRLNLYLSALRDYVVERRDVSNNVDEHLDGYLSNHMHHVLRCPEFDKKIKLRILEILDSMMPQHISQATKKTRRSSRLSGSHS